MCEHTREMRQLLDDLDGQRKREDQSFADGFRVGFEDGFDVGRGMAEEEINKAWSALASKVRGLGKGN